MTAILTVMDTDEGLRRLRDALMEIDGELDDVVQKQESKCREQNFMLQQAVESKLETMMEAAAFIPHIRMTICDAVDGKRRRVRLEDCAGEISAEYVYIYPPGIPLVVPGEELRQEMIDTVKRYQRLGLSVQGMRDESLMTIEVVEEAGAWVR